MTESVQQLIEQMERLPLVEQERYALRFLQELEARPPAAYTDGETVFDRIRHLIGSGEGPPDLASNKAYLKDLGRRSLG